MSLEETLKQIEKMKLEEPSSARIEVSAGALEELYSEIHELRKQKEFWKEISDKTQMTINKLKYDLNLANEMLRAKRTKQIEQYII